jgi:AcrR family transcriptional regulator
MVRTIDGDARRELLADAVWRLLRRGGLEAASVRAVASEAGLSPGSVRHFFATQDELHVFAMVELLRRVTGRVEDALRVAASEEPEGPTPPTLARARVSAGLLELLPVDSERAADFHAHMQFIVKAIVHAPLADVAQRSHRELEGFYLRCVGFLDQAGALAADRDLAVTARELAVFMDGLTLRRLTAPHFLTVEQMTEMLHAYLEALERRRGA